MIVREITSAEGSIDENIKYLELKKYEQQYESVTIENEEEVARYYKLKKKLEVVQDQMSTIDE